MGISERQAWLILGVMEKEGVVVRVEDAYTMARPPHVVTLAQVMGGWRRHTTVRKSTVSETGDMLYDNLVRVPEGTLADAVARWLEQDAPDEPIPLRVDDAH